MRGAQTRQREIINPLVTAWKRKIISSPLSRGNAFFLLCMCHLLFLLETSGSFCKFNSFLFINLFFNLILNFLIYSFVPYKLTKCFPEFLFASSQRERSWSNKIEIHHCAFFHLVTVYKQNWIRCSRLINIHTCTQTLDFCAIESISRTQRKKERKKLLFCYALSFPSLLE